MELEPDRSLEKTGIIVGFIFSYLLFTTILFGILHLLDKIPATWNYLHVMAITLSIVIVGLVIRRLFN